VAKKRGAADPMDAIAEIESRGEKIIEWVGDNARVVLGVAGGLVLVAAIVGYASSRTEKRENAAARAYEEARSEYLRAMGATPGALTAPELANPAAAERIREEFGERFATVAAEPPQTASGVLASVEQGDLVAQAGDAEAARAIWSAALQGVPETVGVAGVLHQRIGRSLEGPGSWESAAEAHAAAAAIDAYPFRYIAMADAARCYAEADDAAKALELYARIEAEAPELQLPDDLRIRLKELRAAQSG